MPDIKTRETIRGTIKALDKSAVAAERMKDNFVRMKQKADAETHDKSESPQDYATEKVKDFAATAASGGAHLLRKTIHHDRHSDRSTHDDQGNHGSVHTQETESAAAHHAEEVHATLHAHDNTTTQYSNTTTATPQAETPGVSLSAKGEGSSYNSFESYPIQISDRPERLPSTKIQSDLLQGDALPQSASRDLWKRTAENEKVTHLRQERQNTVKLPSVVNDTVSPGQTLPSPLVQDECGTQAGASALRANVTNGSTMLWKQRAKEALGKNRSNTYVDEGLSIQSSDNTFPHVSVDYSLHEPRTKHTRTETQDTPEIAPNDDMHEHWKQAVIKEKGKHLKEKPDVKAANGQNSANQHAVSNELPLREKAEMSSGDSHPPYPSTGKTPEYKPNGVTPSIEKKDALRQAPKTCHQGKESPLPIKGESLEKGVSKRRKYDMSGKANKTIKTFESLRSTESSVNAGIQKVKKDAVASEKAKKIANNAMKGTAKAAKRAAVAAAKAAKVAINETKALVQALMAGGWIVVLVVLIVVLFGAALAVFGKKHGNTSYTPVSQEVEAYSHTISTYAKQYGIPEYVELIKAVMMQESGGRGTDPMQCSESGYNTQFPREPNGITDPEYSIEVGVQTLAEVLNMAQVQSPIDMDGISLALQGYNYGSAYISWALSNYGGYSELNAIEYSDLMAEQYGWAGYGDKSYVAHVLQYYPVGRSFMGDGNTAIVSVAQTQIGNEGGLKYCEWYGYPYRVEWCVIFVCWCADQCGYLDEGVLPKMEGVLPLIDWFRERDQWQHRDYEPNPGDLIFYDWESDGIADHVGIVERIENGIVYSIEGNAGDCCIENSHYLGASPIYGYALPAY